MFRRPLKAYERSQACSICAPSPRYVQTINQHIIEGDGVFDEAQWRNALAEAAKANPGARLRLKGHVGFSQWCADGAPPELLVIDSDWDGMSNEGAPFLDTPMDLRNGPLTQVILLRSQTPKVIFRTHHAVTDGMGTRYFIDDVFRALRGEPLLGSPSTLCDIDVVSRFDTQVTLKSMPNILTPTGKTDSAQSGLVWQRLSLPWRVRNVLPRTMLALTAACRTHGEGSVRMRVPVDLRRHDETIRSMANLTSVIFVDIEKTTTERELVALMRNKLKANEETGKARHVDKMRWLPLRLMFKFFSIGGEGSYRNGRYVISAAVSSLGEMPSADFVGGGFYGKRAFGVPIRGYGTPVFVTLWGNEAGLELGFGMPSGLASEGRLQWLCDFVREELTATGKDK